MLFNRDYYGELPFKVEYDFGEKGKHDTEGRVITCHFKTFILVAV